MAAEQRIIGGGLLIVGIAVVLILLYFFAWGGATPKEAFDTIAGEVYPAYVEAEAKGDYLAVKRRAQEILDLMEENGRAAVMKIFEVEATGGDKDAGRVVKLAKSGALEKNAEGRYEFDGEWFDDKAHRLLVRLRDAVDDVKVLRRIRVSATEARAALELARTGSGMPLPLPALKAVPEDDAPIVRPNPVYASDAELYRVFGVTGTSVEAALNTPPPGAGKARSARLKWNNSVVPSNLGADVGAIPDRVGTLRDLASTIERCTRELGRDEAGKKKLADYAARAAGVIAAGLTPEHRAVFEQHRAKFAEGMAVARVLAKEAEMLNEFLPTIRLLGTAFGKEFKE